MSKIKIVSDSSSNVFTYPNEDYTTVPLKVFTSKNQYYDIPGTSLEAMCEELATNREKTQTSCPNAYEWEEAFDKEKDNLCFTISSNLSGSYSAALNAKQAFEEETDHKVEIIDSYSTGPEMELLIEKSLDLIHADQSIAEIKQQVEDYRETTHVYFVTSSVKNLVNNGRIPHLIGKFIEILNLSLVGMGTDEGKIEIVNKSRNYKKTLQYVLDQMVERGYDGGKVRVSHCLNPESSAAFCNLVRERYPNADIQDRVTTILCGYYVEYRGLIIAFEGKKDGR